MSVVAVGTAFMLVFFLLVSQRGGIREEEGGGEVPAG